MIQTDVDHSENRLRVRKFRGTYLLDENHPAAERVQAAFDESLARGLPSLLGSALAEAFPRSDPGLWFIRRLSIDVAVNVTSDREALCAKVAEQLTRELCETLAGGSDGQNVVRFADRKSYLARYLTDRAAGHPEAWYFESFGGLRLLPVSAALRTALLDVPEIGLAALIALTPDERRRVVAALTRHDASSVLEVLADNPVKGDLATCLAAAWSAQQGLRQAPLGGDEAHAALLLFLAAFQPGRVAGRHLVEATRVLVRLLSVLRSGNRVDRVRLVDSLTRGDLADLYRAVGLADGEVLAPLVALRPEWLRDLAAQASPDATTELPPTSAIRGVESTAFGGAFLLLPRLDELPFDEATTGWPDLGSTPPAALVRFLVLIKCFGATRAVAAFRDPILKSVMGVTSEITEESLARWQTQLSRTARNRFLERIEEWSIECGAISLETQILLRSGSVERPVAILIDAERTQWRWVAAITQSADKTSRSFARISRELTVALEQAPAGGRLFCEAEFAESLYSRIPGAQVLELPQGIAPDETHPDAKVWEVISRIDHLADDLQFLGLAQGLGIGSALDRVLTVVAQGVLRSFAWRLPGFSRSHLAHLHANFLEIAASLEEEPDRRVVRLGRPPLGLILNMTGANRGTYRIGWLDDKPFALFPEA